MHIDLPTGLKSPFGVPLVLRVFGSMINSRPKRNSWTKETHEILTQSVQLLLKDLKA